MNQNDMQYQSMGEDTSPRAYQDFSPPMDGNIVGRKRTFSMSEGMPNAFMSQGVSQRASQPAAGSWPGQTPTKYSNQSGEPVSGTENAYTSPLLTNGSAKLAQPFWSQDSEAHGQMGEPADSNMTGIENALVDIDEKALDMYVHLQSRHFITSDNI